MTRATYTAAKDGKVIAQRDALIWGAADRARYVCRLRRSGRRGRSD